MKPTQYILAFTALLFLNCSWLHAIDDTIILMPKNKAVEQMINPPIFPLDKDAFAWGIVDGLTIPIIGLIAMAYPAQRYHFKEYHTFKYYPEKACHYLNIPIWFMDKTEQQAVAQSYATIRRALALGNHAETYALIEDFNQTVRAHSSNKTFDLIEYHNTMYQRHAKNVSSDAGALIGSTLSTCACIYAFYMFFQLIPPQPTCKKICTTVCTPPTINDLD